MFKWLRNCCDWGEILYLLVLGPGLWILLWGLFSAAYELLVYRSIVDRYDASLCKACKGSHGWRTPSNAGHYPIYSLYTSYCYVCVHCGEEHYCEGPTKTCPQFEYWSDKCLWCGDHSCRDPFRRHEAMHCAPKTCHLCGEKFHGMKRPCATTRTQS